MSEPNSMTPLAMQGAANVNGRPPFTAWVLRMMLCVTDSRTQEGDTARLLARASVELSEDERGEVVDTVLACLTLIREGSAKAAEKRRYPLLADIASTLHPFDQDAAS